MKTNKKKKLKLQVPDKARAPGLPKWVPPEKIMRKYGKNVIDPYKIPFVKFVIVVPTEDDKRQLQAGFEFIHDGPILNDNDFIVLNQLAHSYLDPEREEGCSSPIIVDPDTFRDMQQEICPHPDIWNDNGIKTCKLCGKQLEVTSFRD